ncbi:penicillin-binding protein 2 [Candidatus Kaiserbacteria bacterium]|nr:penicillin-binding protein 2 [Candidatus Kaiserbacteria bacterium]
MINARFVTRVRVVVLLCILVALALITKLYYLQVMHGAEYVRVADAQQVDLQSPLVQRGTIYFSARDGTLLTAATLQDLSTASSTEHQRYYPGGSLAAHALGFVAYNNDNEQKGRYGLERYYEQTLARGGGDSYSNFFVELFGGFAGAFSGTGGGQGDLITTIEPSVQSELERTLVGYAGLWHPALAGGIIMDPHTGEIVAMATLPTFDLNTFNLEKGTAVFKNPQVESVYEMGSIIKPLTVAAGLDSGTITEATTYDDTGCVTLDQKKICNFDLKARGIIPMQEILSQSLNVGSAFVATKMGPTVFREYFLDRYKLGTETGIDLPGELHGLVKNLQSPRQVEYATAAFGQGIAITPIETVCALSALGNGGLLVTPHLVRAVKYDNGVTRSLSWGEGEQVLKPETSTAISRMLTKVVDTTLANGTLKMEHYSLAAKTGTAQIADPDNGGYYADRYLHSFFGYVPSYDPKFIVFLFAVEPTGASFSSQTWAAPFGGLIKFLIHYYSIPPDR